MRRLLPCLLVTAAACNGDVAVQTPPRADAGFDQVVLAGESVTLNGARSKAADGKSEGLTYDWRFLARPDGSSAAISGEGARPTFEADAAGLFIVRLTVSQAGTTSSPDYVNITAQAPVGVAWSVPRDGDVSVSASTPLVVAFSGPVQAATVHAGTVALSGPVGNVEAAISPEPSQQTFVLWPTAPLSAASDYRLLVTQGVTDLHGRTLAAPYSIRFRTADAGGDLTPPLIQWHEPAAGASASAGTPIRLAASEPLAEATVSGASVTVADAAGGPRSGSVYLTAAATQIIFVPDSAWSPGATYTVTARSSISDPAGNALDGDADGVSGGDFAFSFVVEGDPDNTPPRVAYVIPGDGFSDFGLRGALTVAFTEIIDASTLDALSLQLTADDAPGQAIPAQITLGLTRDVATLQPTLTLRPDTPHRMTVTARVTDLAGNALDGDADGSPGGDFVSRFTTAHPTGVTGRIEVVSSHVPGTSLAISVSDSDLDLTPAIDITEAIVTSASGEAERVQLDETAPRSGIFGGAVAVVFEDVLPGIDGDGRIAAHAGDTLTVTYLDQYDAQQGPQTIQASVSVLGGNDGALQVVNAPGDVIELTVTDGDAAANLSGAAGVLGCGARAACVVVRGPATGDLEELPLLVETAQEGLFSATLATSASSMALAGNGVLELGGAGQIEAVYTDALRANGDHRGYAVSASTSVTLALIIVRDAPNGGGNEIGALTLSADDTLRLYAAGYDDQGGYVGDQVVDWLVEGSIGTVTPASASSVSFDPTTVGFGQISATHPDTAIAADSTGLVRVVAGSIRRVLIRDAEGGLGSEVGATSVTADTPQTFFAAGYDTDGNYVADTGVNWSVTGAIGVVTPTIGSTTQFDPTTVGTGAVRARPSSVTIAEDSAGPISVSGGVLARIVIYTIADDPGTANLRDGSPLGNLPLSTDDTATLYAAGFDADGNYIEEVSVNWSVTGGIGVVSPGTGSSTVFDPRTVGSGQLVASDATAGATATSGVVTVAAGVLSEIVVLDGANGAGAPVGPASITTDDRLTVFAAGYDADGNFLGDQTVTWSVLGGIGQIAAGPAVSSVFDATQPGSGTIRAVRGGTSGSSGDLAVSEGIVAAVRVQSAANCAGADVGAQTLTADQTLTVHAVGFDADGNCTGNESVTWTVTGGIGDVAPAVGASTTVFDARRIGSGVIRATHATAAPDDSGTITVSVGQLTSLRIRSAPNGAGTEVGALTIDVGRSVDLFAAGYDADGNLISPDPSNVDWSTVGSIGSVSPPSGSATTFTAAGAPTNTGNVHAAHAASAAADDTGTIRLTTSQADLTSVRIMDGPECGAAEVAAPVRSTDQTLTLYALGFDSANNCIPDPIGPDAISVTWTVSGGGTIDPGPNPSTLFDPTVANTTATITATCTDKLGAPINDTTGAIVINAGALSYITIRNGANNSGTPVGDLPLTADASATLYAAGYDADDNYLGDQTVTWSLTAPSVGVLTPLSGANTTLDLRRAGSTMVMADHDGPTVADDVTGTITVTPGVAAILEIMTAPGGTGTAVGAVSLTADQTLTVYAVAFDADGNFVSNESATWSVTGGIGSISAGPSTNAVFSANTVGTGSIAATHPTDSDGTGTITVTPGALRAVVVVDGGAGFGTPVGNRTLSTDGSLTVYAAGYDGDGNYIRDESATWSVNGGIGTVAPVTGTSTVFNPGTIGSGSLLADHPTAGVTDDPTGTLTIVGGSLARIRIRDGANGGGAEVAARTLDADSQITLYAAGYDADDNYLGDQTVTWSASSAIGNLAPSPAPSTIFFANTVGSGAINADHSTPAVTDDATGLFTVTPGAPSYVRVRSAAGGAGSEVGALPLNADQTQALFAATYDADGNFLGDQTVNWSVSGGIGTVAPASGASTSFDARTVGSGAVTANHPTPSVTDDSTGTITVGPGTLAYVRVRDAASGGGNEVGALTLDVGSTFTVHAAGYDADGNFTGAPSVTWQLTILTAPLSGGIAPVSGAWTTFTPNAQGEATITADHATATDDSTGLITAVGSGAPSVGGISPATALRNSSSVMLTISGDNFSCSGGAPTVTFLPINNISVASYTACSLTQISLLANVPCTASSGTYDVMVTNPDGQFGIGSALFTVSTESEGPFGVSACSDGRDNDCDGTSDGTDPGCAPPSTIGITCPSPAAFGPGSSCTIDLDGVPQQAGFISCTATPEVTQIFHEQFFNFQNWTTTGTPQIATSGIPNSAMAANATWTAERTIDTRGMDHVCVDFRIGQNGAGNGETLRLQASSGGAFVDVFSIDFANWRNNNRQHDDPTTPDLADWFVPACITDALPTAANNPSVRLRILADSNMSGVIYLDDLIVTGIPGNRNRTCDGMSTLNNWTPSNPTNARLATFDGSSAVIHDGLGTTSSLTDCFSAATYDVVDVSFDFGQSGLHDSKLLELQMCAAKAGIPCNTTSAMPDSLALIRISSSTTLADSWSRNNELYGFQRQLRYTDVEWEAARNSSVCMRFVFSDNTTSDTAVDNVCVTGYTFRSNLFSVGAVSEVGGGLYSVVVDANQPSSAGVSCTFSRGAVTLATDCSAGPTYCPATVRFIP